MGPNTSRLLAKLAALLSFATIVETTSLGDDINELHRQIAERPDAAKTILNDAGIDWCSTELHFLARFPQRVFGDPAASGCPAEGAPDAPEVRDANIPTADTPLKIIRLQVVVFRNDDGSNAATTQAAVDAQMQLLNSNFLPYRVQFVYQTAFVNSSAYRSLASAEEDVMKAAHAIAPAARHNIFVVNVESGYLGKSTFPWDPDAVTALGGTVMDDGAFGVGRKTLIHEIGHALGLWHTHHGVSEVSACSVCYERADGLNADTTGDFCSDTPPTPVNWNCAPPPGTDSCSGLSWGPTATQNFMGYAPDSCYSEFSPQQAGRIHGWIGERLGGWIEATSGPAVILSQPASRTVVEGANAEISVMAGGAQPLFYQWYRQNVALAGKTNAALYFASVSTNDAGVYSVVVSNSLGSVTSSTATLTVYQAATTFFDDFQPGIDMAQWTSFGGMVGSTILATNYGGSVSAPNSLWFGDSGSRFAVTRWVNTSAGGQINFYLRLADGVSPWELADLPTEGIVLEYSTNSTAWVEMGRYDSAIYQSWSQVSVSLPPGAQGSAVQFRWRQLSHSGSGFDHWALDDVMISTGPQPPVIMVHPGDKMVGTGGTVTFLVTAGGSAPLRYQWRKDGSPLLGATNSSYTIVNVQSNHAGLYSVVVTNLIGSVTSSNAVLAVSDPGSEFFDDFEPGIDLPQWAAFGGSVGSTILATNYGGSVSAPNSLWFGDGASRFAVTRSLDTSSGGQISFSLRLADGTSTVWELADLPLEGIVLEYSTNGTTWVEAGRYDTSSYFTWSFVSMGIPTGAQASSVQFRWRQLSHTGAGLDHWALDNVWISTGPQPPGILTQPQNRSVVANSTAIFSVVASGSSPLSYQWRKEGLPISGATNSSHVISNVQTNDAGFYSVVVTNILGSVTSSNAMLTVVEAGSLDFQITGMFASNSKVVDHNALTSDDRGGIAVSTTHAFVTGDSATAKFIAADLSSGTSLGRLVDSLCTDLRTETVYMLGNGTNALTGAGGTVSTMIELNGSTGQPTGTVVPLTQSFTMPSSANGIFSGFGRVVVYNGSRVFDILLPSGTVTDWGAMTRPNWAMSESWSIWGVAEYFNGALYLAYRDGSSSRIMRAQVPDGATNVVATFTSLSDLSSFTVSPSYNRWYFHHESSSQFGGSSETLGYADASFSYVSVPQPPVVISQPTGKTAVPGANVTFNVTASGTAPLHYQWRKNGGPVPGATNNTYLISNVQTNDAGIYSVVITNALGSVVSSNAVLSVIAGGTSFTINFDEIAAPCYFSLTSPLTNQYAALGVIFEGPSPGSGGAVLGQCGGFGVTGHSASNFLAFSTSSSYTGGGAPRGPETIRFNPPAAYIQIRVGSSSGGTATIQAFDASGVQLDTATATISSTLMPLQVAASTIAYVVISSTASTFVIDDLTIISSGPTPPAIVTQPQSRTVAQAGTTTFSVSAIGAAPLKYQWRKDGFSVSGATNSSYTISNVQTNDAGTYSVVVTNTLGSATSSNAVLTVIPAGSGIAYLRASVGSPWNTSTNEALMNRVFGTGNWQDLRFETVDATLLFSPANRFVFMDGSEYGAIEMETFLSANRAAMETWVGSGGRIFLNAAPNEGDGMPLGFGATLTYSDTTTDGRSAAMHQIFLAPYSPVGTTWTGSSFGHATITGTNLFPLITNATHGRIVLAEMSFGAGRVFFGGMTTPNFHNPPVEASNLRANILHYGFFAPGTNTPPQIISHPPSQTVGVGDNATFTVFAGGTAPMGYQWRRDGSLVIGATNSSYTIINVQTNDVAIYSVVITNAFGSATSSNATLAIVPPASVISVFDHPSFVDTTSGGVSAESDNVQASLRSLGYAVGGFTNIVPGIAGRKVIVFPDLEVASLAASLSALDRGAVSNFVMNGGAMLVHSSSSARSAALINTVFGLSLVEQSEATGTVFNRTSHAGATRFGDDPVSVAAMSASTSIQSASLPAGTLPVYTNSTRSAVAMIPRGGGLVIFLGWDWYDAAPVGAQNGGWLQVLQSAVEEGRFVAPTPPTITNQPKNVFANVGENVSFNVVAVGSSFLRYQWQRDGSPLIGATNSTYSITNVQNNHAGLYRVVVTNAFGTAISANAQLIVTPVLTLAESLDTFGMGWSTSSSNGWFGQRTITYDGVDAAQSGLIADGAQSWVQATVTGPGELRFSWKVSSEVDYDFLEFYTNGVLAGGRISGEVNWQQQIHVIGAGTQALRWRYAKDGSMADGLDTGWLDSVSFVPFNILTSGSNFGFQAGKFGFEISGPAGRVVVVEAASSLNPPNWTGVWTNNLSGGSLYYSDPQSDINHSRFYRVRFE